MKGEIIEDYPLDEFNISTESYPSCLLLGITVIEQKALHVVIGYKETTSQMLNIGCQIIRQGENNYV